MACCGSVLGKGSESAGWVVSEKGKVHFARRIFPDILLYSEFS